MTNSNEKFDYLYKFMRCYWMETADIAYGNLTGAVNAFIDLESTDSARGLIDDLDNLISLGHAVEKVKIGSKDDRFWRKFGARWLSAEDVHLVKFLLRRSMDNSRRHNT